jgi:hypothetical protein
MSAMSSATRQDVLGSRSTAPREWPPRLTRASELARHIDAATLAGALMLDAQARLTVGQLDQVAPVLAKAERIGLPVEAVLLDRRMTIYADLSMALGRTREALERYAQSLEYAQAAGNELQVAFDLRGVAKPLSLLCQDEEVLEIVGMAQAHVSELGGPSASLIGHALARGVPRPRARRPSGPAGRAGMRARACSDARPDRSLTWWTPAAARPVPPPPELRETFPFAAIDSRQARR